MVAAPTLEQLPEEDRRLVETWRTEFERGWRRDRLAERVGNCRPGATRAGCLPSWKSSASICRTAGRAGSAFAWRLT